MEVEKEYFITETPLIIHDYYGDKYSVLPAGVALYPLVDDINTEGNYVIYINFQPQFGDLNPAKDNNSNFISKLYLSIPPADIKKEDNKVLTRDDLLSLLQKSTLTKQDFAEVISRYEE